MKLNFKVGLLKMVIVASVVVALIYEMATGLLKNYFSWDNGFIFSLKIIIVPAILISLIVWAINWCIKGFMGPKLNINWKEGGNRLAIFLKGFKKPKEDKYHDENDE